jgi:hypothetical protein
MKTREIRQSWWRRSSRPPVDVAYTAWFNAHSRCSDAWRRWKAAAPGHRATAYRDYLAELHEEEVAAAELARLHDALPAAA